MDPLKMKPYNEALWAWFLSKAKLRTVYGPVEDSFNEKLHKHLEQCGIDMDNSDIPDVGTISEFADTFSENDELDGVVVERWSCLCKKWRSRSNYSLAILGEIKLNEVIYEVLQQGQGNLLLESVTKPDHGPPYEGDGYPPVR